MSLQDLRSDSPWNRGTKAFVGDISTAAASCAGPDEPLAFVDAAGHRLAAETLSAYLQALARITINAEFNGALCRGLLAARYNEDGEPTLDDFARMPPGKAA